MEKAVRLNKDPCGIKWLACPMCRAKTSFNSEDPVVDLGRCEALKLFRGKGMTVKRLDEQEMAGAAGAALRLIRAADITIASQAATIASHAEGSSNHRRRRAKEEEMPREGRMEEGKGVLRTKVIYEPKASVTSGESLKRSKRG